MSLCDSGLVFPSYPQTPSGNVYYGLPEGNDGAHTWASAKAYVMLPWQQQQDSSSSLLPPPPPTEESAHSLPPPPLSLPACSVPYAYPEEDESDTVVLPPPPPAPPIELPTCPQKQAAADEDLVSTVGTDSACLGVLSDSEDDGEDPQKSRFVSVLFEGKKVIERIVNRPQAAGWTVQGAYEELMSHSDWMVPSRPNCPPRRSLSCSSDATTAASTPLMNPNRRRPQQQQQLPLNKKKKSVHGGLGRGWSEASGVTCSQRGFERGLAAQGVRASVSNDLDSQTKSPTRHACTPLVSALRVKEPEILDSVLTVDSFLAGWGCRMLAYCHGVRVFDPEMPMEWRAYKLARLPRPRKFCHRIEKVPGSPRYNEDMQRKRFSTEGVAGVLAPPGLGFEGPFQETASAAASDAPYTLRLEQHAL